jgi:hypothetical protein
LASIARLVPSFAVAVVLGAAYYASIALFDSEGPTFVLEFLMRHNLGRTTLPMQGHSGNLLYYPLVLWVGGGGLTAAAGWTFVRAVRSPEPWLFPWSFAAAWVGAMSLIATKLPNYIWPAFPALSLATCLELRRGVAESISPRRWLSSILARGGLALPGAAAIALGLASDPVRASLAFDPRGQAIAEAFGPVPGGVRFGLVAIGALLLLEAAWVPRRGDLEIERFLWRAPAIHAVAIVLGVALGAAFLRERVSGPLTRLGHEGARLARESGRRFATIDLFSPTVTRAAGAVDQRGRGDDAPFSTEPKSVVLLPVWLADACPKNDYRMAARDGYLLLCTPDR